MNESTMCAAAEPDPLRAASVREFTPAASLAAVGLHLHQLQLFEPIHRLVQLKQKTVKYRPTDKLYDGFIALLAGAHGLVEINTRLRADPALQAAFGRTGCAEQVEQMEQALDEIYRAHRQGYRHDYARAWQLLDVDLSGWLCGKKAAFATKGYFATTQRNRRGRQLGRVLATRYGEVVVDRLFPGNQQLNVSLPDLVAAAATTLALTAAQRARCLIRVDAGGGTVPNINTVLDQGYQVLAKGCSGQQAQRLAKTVAAWLEDPRLPERQVGWISEPASGFSRPVRRVAVRCPKPNGRWGVGVLICTLSDPAILELAGPVESTVPTPPPAAPRPHEQAVLLALVRLYDQRGGGIETSFKGDKGGLGLTKRNKKRFAAQQVLMLLGTLAHNTVIWARSWLTAPVGTASPSTALAHYGPMRMVRDVFHISGCLRRDATGRLVTILLHPNAPWAPALLVPLVPLQHLLAPLGVVVILDKT